MNINEIENLKKALKPKSKGLLDILAAIRNKEVYPITNEAGTIIGINCTHKATAMNVCKKIGSHMTIGANEEERKADEAELRKFLAAYEGKPIQDYFEIALQLDAANITPVDVIEDYGDIYLVLEDGRTIDRYGNEVDFNKLAEEHNPQEESVDSYDEPTDDDCDSDECDGAFQDSQGRWRDCHGRFVSR